MLISEDEKSRRHKNYKKDEKSLIIKLRMQNFNSNCSEKLYLSNLYKKTAKSDIEDLFKNYNFADIIPNDDRSTWIVSFDNQYTAFDARIACNYREIHKFPVYIHHRSIENAFEANTLLKITNFPSSLQLRKLHSYLESAKFEVVYVKKDNEEILAQFFSAKDARQAVQKLNGKLFMNRLLNLSIIAGTQNSEEMNRQNISLDENISTHQQEILVQNETQIRELDNLKVYQDDQFKIPTKILSKDSAKEIESDTIQSKAFMKNNNISISSKYGQRIDVRHQVLLKDLKSDTNDNSLKESLKEFGNVLHLMVSDSDEDLELKSKIALVGFEHSKEISYLFRNALKFPLFCQLFNSNIPNINKISLKKLM